MIHQTKLNVGNNIGQIHAVVITETNQHGEQINHVEGTIPANRTDYGSLETIDQIAALAGSERVTPNAQTTFPIGSVSKLFTVAAFNKAGIDTKSNLRENLARWSSGLQKLYKDEPDVAEAFAAVINKTKPGATILDLMNHTSGLPGIGIDRTGSWESRHPYYNHAGDNADKNASPACSLRANPQIDEVERKDYSNAAYVLLHMIFEGEKGEKLEGYIQSEFIEGLNLQNTKTGLQEKRFNAVGSMQSSSEDLMKFMRHLAENKELAKGFEGFEKKTENRVNYVGHSGGPYVGSAEAFVCMENPLQGFVRLASYVPNLYQNPEAVSQIEDRAAKHDLTIDITKIDPNNIQAYEDIISPPSLVTNAGKMEQGVDRLDGKAR